MSQHHFPGFEPDDPVHPRRKIVVVGCDQGREPRSAHDLQQHVDPILTIRNYEFPRAVGQGCLVFCSSYSGDTEETLALYEDARRRRARVLCITTGGKLAEQCGRDGVPWIRIPSGIFARSASVR